MAEGLLALDVGNSHTVVGLFANGDLVADWRLATHAERTADETGLWLRQLLQWQGFESGALCGVAVASVVPPVDPVLGEAVRRYLEQEPFFVRPGIRTGMPLRVETPQELGADRLCDAVAAYHKFGGPCVVLDFGTAVTWEVISARGEYLGGAIAPGPGITLDALFTRTAKLPRVALEPPPRVIGKATVDSIQIGVFYGYLGLVREVTERILGELGPAPVVATGGFAEVMARHCRLIERVEPHLTLEGLELLWRRNRGQG